MNKQPLYLDYQATTPVDPEVLKVMLPFFSDRFVNPASSNKLGFEINSIIVNGRNVIAKSLNCKSNEIIFTSGATESINTAIKGLFEFNAKGHVVTLKTEHSAVLNTCRYLERKGVDVTYLDVEKNGLVNLQKLSDAITSDTKLVAVMHVNNEIGVVQPIEEIGKICFQKNIPFFVDTAQSFGKMEINVLHCNISMLAVSGHKIYAPKGIGALYVSKKIKSKIIPLIHGGGQEDGLRSGTLNVPGIVGLSRATEIAVAQMQAEQTRVLTLRNLLLKLIQEKVSDVIVNGDLENRVAGNINLCFKNVSGDVLMNRLENIVVSRGSACNSSKNQGSHVLKAIGLSDELADSAIRISIGRFTSEKEIMQAAEQISSIVNDIRKISIIA
jgi:cysteine desulfurase